VPANGEHTGMKTISEVIGRAVIQENGCALWPGSLNGSGYAHGRWGRRVVTLHRLLYEAVKGPVPDGMVLDHVCGERSCINFAHLEPVTSGENTRRGRRPQREKTHCPEGHLLSGDNLYRTNAGARQCRACKAANAKRRAAEIRQGAAVQAGTGFCHRGHLLAGENLYTSPSGKRNCRQCRRDLSRERIRQRLAAREPLLRAPKTIIDVMEQSEPSGDGCLLWTGRTLPNGYGITAWKGRPTLVHRLAYAEFVGALPKGAEIHHRCGRQLCVHPGHLEPMDPETHRRVHEATR
jgi:HNH endonuclease